MVPLTGARVYLDGVEQHRLVTVEMRDAEHEVVVFGFQGARWGLLARYENATLNFRKANGTASFSWNGHELLIEKKRGCGCR